MNPYTQGLTAGSEVGASAVNTYMKEKELRRQAALNQKKLALTKEAMQQKEAAQQGQSQENQQLINAKLQAAQDAHNKAILMTKYPGIFSANPAIHQSALVQMATDNANAHPNAMSEIEAQKIGSVTGKHPITGESIPVTNSTESLYGKQPDISLQSQAQSLAPSPSIQDNVSSMGEMPQAGVGQQLIDAQSSPQQSTAQSSAFSPMQPTQGMPVQQSAQLQQGTTSQTGSPSSNNFSENDTLSDIRKLVANKQLFTNDARLKMPDIGGKIIPKPNFTAPANTALGSLQRSNYDAMKQKLEPSIIKQQYANAIAWRGIDAQDKARSLAYAAGMGVDAPTASKFFTKGGTLGEMAKQLGYNLENVRPNYAPVTKTLGSEQQQSLAMAAMRPVEANITDWMAPYSKRFAGYSFKNIVQQISGDDPEQQAKFFAAYTLVPELMAARTRALQGTFGEGFYQSARESSFGKLKAMRNLMTPQVWKLSQQYVEQTYDESLKSARSNLNTFGSKNYQDIYNQSEPSKIFAPSSKQPLAIPTFNNKAEAVKWYSNLSPADKSRFNSQLGGSK